MRLKDRTNMLYLCSNCCDQFSLICRAFSRLFTMNTPGCFFDLLGNEIGFNSMNICKTCVSYLFSSFFISIIIYLLSSIYAGHLSLIQYYTSSKLDDETEFSEMKANPVKTTAKITTFLHSLWLWNFSIYGKKWVTFDSCIQSSTFINCGGSFGKIKRSVPWNCSYHYNWKIIVHLNCSVLSQMSW